MMIMKIIIMKKLIMMISKYLHYINEILYNKFINEYNIEVNETDIYNFIYLFR